MLRYERSVTSIFPFPSTSPYITSEDVPEVTEGFSVVEGSSVVDGSDVTSGLVVTAGLLVTTGSLLPAPFIGYVLRSGSSSSVIQ